MSQIFKLALEGDATIRTIATVRTRLLDALQAHQAVELDCTGLEVADVTLVQCLYATGRSAALEGRRFTLTCPLPPLVKTILARGGFQVADGQAGDAALLWCDGGLNDQ